MDWMFQHFSNWICSSREDVKLYYYCLILQIDESVIDSTSKLLYCRFFVLGKPHPIDFTIGDSLLEYYYNKPTYKSIYNLHTCSKLDQLIKANRSLHSDPLSFTTLLFVAVQKFWKQTNVADKLRVLEFSLPLKNKINSVMSVKLVPGFVHIKVFAYLFLGIYILKENNEKQKT